jgi:hypothetical protein
MINIVENDNKENSTSIVKSKTSVRKYLQEQLTKKYSAQFITRKIKEEEKAGELSDYIFGNGNNNTTLDKKEIISYLNHQDNMGLKIMNGVGILQSQSNTILNQYNQDNRQQTTIISDNVLSLFSGHAEDLIESDNTEVVDIQGDSDNE